jgi:hypothetical protein
MNKDPHASTSQETKVGLNQANQTQISVKPKARRATMKQTCEM